MSLDFDGEMDEDLYVFEYRKVIKEAETLRCRRQLEGGILCSRYCMFNVVKVRSCGRGVCTMPPSRVRVLSFFRGGPGWDLVVGASEWF